MQKGASVTKQKIKELASARLADFKVPRVVLWVDEIPKDPTGKPQRIGLAQKLGLTASEPTVPRVVAKHRLKLWEFFYKPSGVFKGGWGDLSPTF